MSFPGLFAGLRGSGARLFTGRGAVQAPMLGTLALGTIAFTDAMVPGAVVTSIAGATSGSTITMTGTAFSAGALAVSGTNVIVGVAGPLAAGVTTGTFSLTEMLAGAANSPNSSGPFGSITVTAAPTALAITGTPATTGTVGTAYSFTPAASGGIAPRTFSIAGGTLPAGLSINAATGAIAGTPTTAGTAAGIVLRVTDAVAATANLASFSITVAAAPATLVAAVPSRTIVSIAAG